MRTLDHIIAEFKKQQEERKKISIEQVLKEKGEEWIVAAMVEGSIGYHSPQGAKQLIRDYINGKQFDACERCYCCYGGDLEAMILSDVERFLYLEKHNPKKVERIINFVKQTAKLSNIGQMTASMFYPTLI
jgi:hypothetical protein